MMTLSLDIYAIKLFKVKSMLDDKMWVPVFLDSALITNLHPRDQDLKDAVHVEAIQDLEAILSDVESLQQGIRSAKRCSSSGEMSSLSKGKSCFFHAMYLNTYNELTWDYIRVTSI